VALLIGALVGLGVPLFGTGVGLDRDRAFYPVITIVVASYYVLFAVMGGSREALVVELLVGSVFVLAAAWGFRSSLWIVAAALAGHGILDFFLRNLISNPGVPVWWPAFCGACDVALAVCLTFLLVRKRIHAVAPLRT
jgi:hypothetical protein